MALAQQQQYSNGNYRGKSNRSALDGATAINKEEDDGNDAAAVDALRKKHLAKPHTSNLHNTFLTGAESYSISYCIF